MSSFDDPNFKREERYIVLKLSDMDTNQTNAVRYLIKNLEIPTRECVVVEEDWNIYDTVWDLVQLEYYNAFSSDFSDRLFQIMDNELSTELLRREQEE